MPKFNLDTALVRKLSHLLEETGLTEIEYEAEGRRIRVARNLAKATSPVEVTNVVTGQPAEGTPQTVEPGAVLAPMVGTVYVAPEPGASPFVRVGDKVAEGQTLLIIEAMKTLNPVPAPHAGTVKQILIRDSALVEYGEVLLILQ